METIDQSQDVQFRSARRGSPALRRTRTPLAPEPAPARGVVLIEVGRCKGCELCIEHCPVKVLVLSNDFNAAGYHYPLAGTDGCIACQACSAICPEFAIFAVPAALIGRARELGLAV